MFDDTWKRKKVNCSTGAVAPPVQRWEEIEQAGDSRKDVLKYDPPIPSVIGDWFLSAGNFSIPVASST